jgi:membrane fusion protein, multidrug efflux system
VEPVKSSKQIVKAEAARQLPREDLEQREGREFIAVPLRPDPPLPSRFQVAARELTLRVKRHLGVAIIFGVLLLLAAPVAAWLHYQSGYVMSRNAIVKGELAEVGTRLAGVVTKLEVHDGQHVRAGQILARLDNSHFQAEAQVARAEVAGMERELEIERAAIDHEERVLQNSLLEAAASLSAAAAEVEAAESRADDAQGYYAARKNLLAAGGAISGEIVREAKAKARTAEALVKGARAEYAAAQSAEHRAELDAEGLALRKERVKVLEAQLSRARARLAAAQADLEGTLIRAPADGAVVRRILRPGGSVAVGTPVLSLWLGDDVWIEAWLDEDDIAFVKLGSSARVTLQSFPGREFDGVVERIGVTTDFEMPASEVPQPRFARMRGAPVVGVLIRIEDPPARLLPGLSAVVGIRKSQA